MLLAGSAVMLCMLTDLGMEACPDGGFLTGCGIEDLVPSGATAGLSECLSVLHCMHEHCMLLKERT